MSYVHWVLVLSVLGILVTHLLKSQYLNAEEPVGMEEIKFFEFIKMFFNLILYSRRFTLVHFD